MRVYNIILGTLSSGKKIPLTDATPADIHDAFAVSEFEPEFEGETASGWDEQARIILSLKSQGLL